MKLLAADDIGSIIGTIAPPGGIGAGGDPKTSLNNFIGKGIQIFITVCAITVLIYMLWGALDWIASGGEKEKIAKAQNKITNAVIGFIIVFIVFAVFNLLMNDVLKLNILNLGK